MGATRITQGLMIQRTLSNLNQQLRRISVLQNRLATGLRVNRPSDDPGDARRAINVRTLIEKNRQFLSNISDVGPQLEESASTLLGVVDIIQRARELVIRAGSEILSQAQLDQIALEIDGLIESTVQAGNHRTNNRSIFAGTRTTGAAFNVTRVAGRITAVVYAGNSVRIEVDISNGIRTTVNETGDAAFQGSQDIFAMLIQIRDDLEAGNQVDLRGPRLDELQVAQDQILFSVARVGAVQNRLDRVQNGLEDFVIELQELLSDKIDADFADTILNLNVEQNALEAALSAAGRVLQPSLLDFLR